MAYNKRNWKARQGTGLNFFSIDGATPVPIVNQPTTLTEAGDALSAGNLNDWEQRIADGFDSASGELADAVEELESEDTALKSAINANSNRIANLEQKAGDYSIVQYRGTNAVPTGKAKYGLVKSIVGKTRAWNQLVQNGNFASTSGWESSGATISASNNVLSFTASAQGGFVRLSSGNAVRFNKNDILLATFKIKGTSSTTIQYTCQNNNYIFNESVSVTTSWKQVVLRSNLTGGDTSGYIFFFDNRESGWDTIYIKEVCIYDLTLIFGAGNEPSTVADALALLPALGQYNAYDAGSLVNTEVSGAKSVGVNLLDSSKLRQGDYNTYSTARVSMNVSDRPYIEAGTYTISQKTSGVLWLWLLLSDADNNLLELPIIRSSAKSATATFSQGGYLTAIFGFSDNSDITPAQVAEQDVMVVKGSVEQPYHPYMTDTLSLSTPVTLRSARSVADELDVESGEITRNVAEVDLGDYTWIYVGTDSEGLYRWEISNLITSNTHAGVCGKYLFNITGNHIVGVEEMLWHGLSKNFLFFTATNYNAPSDIKTAMNGVKLCYVPTTEPTTESIDPIPDNTIYTEGGGTINTIQTQNPIIDNCLDVGYLAV